MKRGFKETYKSFAWLNEPLPQDLPALSRRSRIAVHSLREAIRSFALLHEVNEALTGGRLVALYN